MIKQISILIVVFVLYCFKGSAQVVLSTSGGAILSTSGGVVVDSKPSYPGTNLGPVKIGHIWWAPVNCGYEQGTRPYGLLYQWHRKYGQTYDEVPALKEQEGTTTLAEGSLITNHLNFYDGVDGNWCSNLPTVWSMSETYNPCPAGWRLPVSSEIVLFATNSTWVSSGGPDGLPGRWCMGNHAGDHEGSVFLPASGNISNGSPLQRGNYGWYWTSESEIVSTHIRGASLYFESGGNYFPGLFPVTLGLSVRCVADAVE